MEGKNGKSSQDYSKIDEKKKKKRKPGIVYLSTLPPFMNVTKIKDIFNCYGEVGRVFLQPATGEFKVAHMFVLKILILGRW